MADFVDTSLFPHLGCNTKFFECVQLDKINKTAGATWHETWYTIWSRSQNLQASTGEYVDDLVITIKVNYLLVFDNLLKSFQISVGTWKGSGQLSGFINSQQPVDKACEVARSIKGIKTVKNDQIGK